MGVRILEGRADVPINIRVSASMKSAMDSAADGMRISTAQYVRLAVQEKLERDSAASAVPRDLGEVGQLRAELDRKREDELRRYEEQERRLCELEEKLYEKTQLDEAAAELKERMAALEQQLSALSQPSITQNAGRDAKMTVRKE